MKPDNCPNCNITWVGDRIPYRIRKDYSPPYKWGVNHVGIELRENFDGVSYWKCTNCGATFDRFTMKPEDI